MRSKVLLVSNILATIYVGIIWWLFGGAFITSGGIEFWSEYLSILNYLFEFSSDAVNIIYVLVVLMTIHIGMFTLGTIFGWIGYGVKKSGLAKFSATLYLIGTIAFPIYIFFGLPLIILGFIGGGKQKKINLLKNN